MSQATYERSPAVAFEIGPRESEREFEIPARGSKHPAHHAQLHARVINGTRYLFGRFTYPSGMVAVQAVVQGQAAKTQPDVHYFTNQEEGA
ncbi:hypothetical protein [Streptomyces sp. NPDC056796]|uniref:hypothetical protein n=1 Tax=Streptomyces sp. NPDC056796 TaxID=3345947 RepID=UPI003690AFFE